MGTRKIELTSEQFRNLMKLVYLGHWMANSHRDEPVSEIDEVENIIYSYAEQFGCADWVDGDQKTNHYYPSSELEEEMDPYLEEYDDYTFWDELAWRLADRDFETKFDPGKVIVMTTEEILREKDIIVQKYVNEFNKQGLENVNVKGIK